MEQFSYDDSIANVRPRRTIVWGIVATLAGYSLLVLLILPGTRSAGCSSTSVRKIAPAAHQRGDLRVCAATPFLLRCITHAAIVASADVEATL